MDCLKLLEEILQEEILRGVVLLKADCLRLPVEPLEAAHPRVAPLVAEPQEGALQEVVRLEVVLLEEVLQEEEEVYLKQPAALQEAVLLVEVLLEEVLQEAVLQELVLKQGQGRVQELGPAL